MRLIKCFAIILILSISIPVFSFSDQLTTERILRENKDFLDFMNVCISNFADEKKDEFKNIYQIHFNADIAYLQSDYRRAYKNVYRSQKMQADLYLDIADKYYLEDAKNILDRFAPGIIKSKNTSARLYLTLGYRDRAVAKNFMTIGKASNPKLHSYRIYKYLDSVKMSRRAKRYGFLALYESQPVETKKKIYEHLFEIERETGSDFFLRFLSKDEDGYIEEMNKEYYDYKPETPAGEEVPGSDDTFERTLEKRVRFKNERRVAEYLLNAEFEKAERLIHKYVDDFNFKKILATIEMLAARSQGTVVGFNVERLKRVHYDNYGKLDRQSMLESFYSDVKVVDDIKKDNDGEATEETVEDAEKTEEKSEEAEDETREEEKDKQ